MRTRDVVALLGSALMRSAGVSCAGSAVEPVPADPHGDPAAIVEIDGDPVAFESQPLSPNSCSGAAEDFVFRIGPDGGTEAPSPFIRVRYVRHDDEEPPPDDLRTADRMWHIAVTRDPRCDARIDDLRFRKVIAEDGGPTPSLPYFQQAPGRHAEATPTGTVLRCYVLRPGDAR